MKRSVVETILGAVVLTAAGVFLAYGYKIGNVSTPDGYEIFADFSGTGGLEIGDQVRISGVKVGSVKGINLLPDNYLARVRMDVDSKLKLPVDTAAVISSESLMGGKYLQLDPGADDVMMEPGGVIEYTQAPQNLEQLLGQFIFSMKDGKGQKGEEQAQAEMPAAAPAAPAPVVSQPEAAAEPEAQTQAPADTQSETTPSESQTEQPSEQSVEEQTEQPAAPQL